jgi:hypothetical protein
MWHRCGAKMAALTMLSICLLSTPGCWRQRAVQAQVVAARAAAQAEMDAARAAQEAALNVGRAKGTAEAQRDIGNNILKLKEYPPTPAPAWQAKYVELLKERCNVEYEVVQGPPGISETLQAEVVAYNDVMKAEIERRFEVGILDRLRKEAEGI